MKKFIFPILFLIATATVLHGNATTHAQSIPVSPVNFGTLADLRAQAGSAFVTTKLMGLTTVNDGNGGDYVWLATSTATDDGFLVVAVTGVTTGRWIRVISSNIYHAQVTMSGVALQTAYPVTFPTAMPIVPSQIYIQAKSAGAAVLSWISNITTTGFTANFGSVLNIGTNNIVIDYLVIKQ